MIPFQAICTLIAVEHRAGFGAAGSPLGRCCFVAVPYIVRYVDDATTARFDSSYVITGWAASYNNNCESASLIPSRRAALLVSSALASPNASNSPQTVSIFTTKSADSSAELRWRFEVFRSSESSCTGRSSCARPPYKRSSSSQAPLPSGLPPCPHRATMAAADPLVDCARRNRRNVCCVDTFRTPCADPMSSLLSERPLWRNPVVAEGIFPFAPAHPTIASLHAFHVSRECPRAPVHIGSLRGSVSP